MLLRIYSQMRHGYTVSSPTTGDCQWSGSSKSAFGSIAGINAALMQSMGTNSSLTYCTDNSTSCIIAGASLQEHKRRHTNPLLIPAAQSILTSLTVCRPHGKAHTRGWQTSWQVETRSFQMNWSNQDDFRPLFMHIARLTPNVLVYARRLHQHHHSGRFRNIRSIRERRSTR
jgi:hypothetical protein